MLLGQVVISRWNKELMQMRFNMFEVKYWGLMVETEGKWPILYSCFLKIDVMSFILEFT